MSAGAQRPVRVVVVDDHQLVRAGIRAETAGRLHVLGEAGDVATGVEAVRRTRPEVVLVDVRLPGGGGAEVVRACRDLDGVAFLAVSASDEPADVVDVVRAGARGYVVKTAPTDELVDAARAVAAGGAWFTPRLAGHVLDALGSALPARPDPELERLTDRERDVLRGIARGLTYRETAEELVVSPRTVETHVSSILRKLQLQGRRELERWAAERGAT